VPSPADVETARNLRASPRMNPASAESDASKARFAEAVARGNEGVASAPTAAFAGDDEVVVPPLGGETVRGVMEECSKVGLAPDLIGNGIALEQFPSAGTQVPRGSRVTVRFGQPGEAGSGRGSGN
jgi:PASTA domain